MSGEVGERQSSTTYALPIDTYQQSLPLPPGGEPEGGETPPGEASSRAEALVPRFLGKSDPPLAPETTPLSESYTPQVVENPQTRLVSGWEITAGGPRPRDCGEGKVRMFCEACGHWFKVDVCCKSRTCPHCGVKWAHEQGASMAHRLVVVGETPLARGSWGREAIISPPRTQWGRLLEDDVYVKKKRSQAASIAKKMGFRGGAPVFHPYRDSDEQGHYDVDGPHFHFIGWADKLKPMDHKDFRRLKSAGWIFWGVCHVDGKAKRYRNYPQFYDKCQYELSHCAIIDGMHAFSWYGICHYSKTPLSEKERTFRKEIKGCACPDCGSYRTVPQELVQPDAELDKKPFVGHRGQTRVKLGAPIRFHRPHRALL